MILRNQDYKESDRLVWLFSEKLGKISVVVHGARKTKSMLTSLTSPFTFGEFVLFKGKSMYTLNEGQIIESFQGLLCDLDQLTYATYLNELIDISIVEEESNRELFKDFVAMFYLMNNKAGDIQILTRAFELKLLRYTGYNLRFDNCSICGEKVLASEYISVPYYGVVCSRCPKGSAIKVSPTAMSTLKYINRISLEKVCRISPSKEVNIELESLMTNLIRQSYSKTPNSLDFIKILRSDKNE